VTKDEFYFWSTVATLVIAICALGFSIWQGYIARDHNIRSVKPCLNVIKESQADYFELKLSNVGLGPAFVQKISRFLDDKAINSGDLETEIEFILQNKHTPSFFRGEKGVVISPGESISIFRINFTNGDDFDLSHLLAKRIDVECEYTCVYGKQFE
jgi:hypothetical protein